MIKSYIEGLVIIRLKTESLIRLAAGKISLSTVKCRQSAQTAEQKAFCLMLLHEEADYSVPLLISAGKNDVLPDRRESFVIVPKEAVPKKQERKEFAA